MCLNMHPLTHTQKKKKSNIKQTNKKKNTLPPLILICTIYLKAKVRPKHRFSLLEYVSTVTEDLLALLLTCTWLTRVCLC